LWEAKKHNPTRWDADEGWQELEGLFGQQTRFSIKSGSDEQKGV